MALTSESSFNSIPLPTELTLYGVCSFLPLDNQINLALTSKASLEIIKISIQLRISEIARNNLQYIANHETLSQKNAVLLQNDITLPNHSSVVGTLTLISDKEGKIQRLLSEFPVLSSTFLKKDEYLLTIRKSHILPDNSYTSLSLGGTPKIEFSLGFSQMRKQKIRNISS